MENIIVIGSSGHAKIVINAIESINKKQGLYKIVCLIDDFRQVGECTWEHRILGKTEDLPKLIDEYLAPNVAIAIGDNFGRMTVADRIKKLCSTVHFPCIIHPNSVLDRNVKIGEGSFIGAQVHVAADSTIGKFCNLMATQNIGHDSILGDFCSVAPGTAIGGNVRIGLASVVSLGVTINEKLNIGEHTIIGAGSTVVRDISSFVVAYGSPAKTIRTRKPEDSYM
ncbi:MAG: NeuD/PglB/VioB family sugar acetyltransferase [Thermodesulfobacteriota bacterium]